MHAQGVVTWVRAVKVPKREKWAHMLPAAEQHIADKLGSGWDVAFVDGSRDTRGVEFAGYGVWFGDGDSRNESSPLTSHKQTVHN